MKRHPAMAGNICPGSKGESPENLATQITAAPPPADTEPYLELTAGALRVRPLVRQRPAAKRLRAAHTLLLSGTLDRSSTHMLEAEIERLCGSGVNEITLDLAQLVGVDFAGAAVIAFRRNWCRRRGCALSLARCTPDVRVALAAAGVGDLLSDASDTGTRIVARRANNDPGAPSPDAGATTTPMEEAGAATV